MAYRLSSGILQGPSRLQARDRKLSRASQSTGQVSDHQGGSASTIRTLAGCRGNEEDQYTRLPELEEPAGLFLLSMDILKQQAENNTVFNRGQHNNIFWREHCWCTWSILPLGLPFYGFPKWSKNINRIGKHCPVMIIRPSRQQH